MIQLPDGIKISSQALRYEGRERQLEVMQSRAGYYIGTSCDDGGPNTRDSVEYFPTEEAAQEALDNNTFTPRLHP